VSGLQDAVRRGQSLREKVVLHEGSSASQNPPPDEEGTAVAKRGRGGQTPTNPSNNKMFQLYDLPALTAFGVPSPSGGEFGDLNFEPEISQLTIP
jgi:hypothetical protein